MNYRLIALGIASAFLLIICMATVFLVGISGRFLIRQEESSQPIRIIPVAPLNTPVRLVTEEKTIESPPEGIAASAKQPLGVELPAITPTPTYSPTPTTTPSPTNTPSPTATSTPTITQKGVATRLVIPRLNLDSPILFAPIVNETWRVDHLEQAIGHLEGTAPPGSDSNIVLAGHVTLETGEYGPFAGLAQLAAGDMITVYEGSEAHHYMVDNLKVVDRLSVEVVYPSKTGQITLITCTNWNKEEGRYTDRVVVKGQLIKGDLDSK